MFSAVVRDFACFRVFANSQRSAPRAPPTSSLAPLGSIWTTLSIGAKLVAGGGRGATCWEFETRKKWSMIWARFRQKHENFRKNHPGSPGFFRRAFFLGSWRCYFDRDIIEKWKCDIKWRSIQSQPLLCRCASNISRKWGFWTCVIEWYKRKLTVARFAKE